MTGQQLNKAIEAWLNSPEGVTCSASPVENPYLQNRLRRAFAAGAEFAARIIANPETPHE